MTANATIVIIVSLFGALTALLTLMNAVATFINSRHLNTQDKSIQEIHVMVNERLDAALRMIRHLQGDMLEINKATIVAIAHHSGDPGAVQDALENIKSVSTAPEVVRPGNSVNLTDSSPNTILALTNTTNPRPLAGREDDPGDGS